MYQQTRLSDNSAVGAPGDLPYCVANWRDVDLADLDAMRLDPQFGLVGMGLWPVDVAIPSFDPTHQVLVRPVKCDAVDPKARRWTATATVRVMTPDELATANPVPQSVTNYQARAALIAAGLLDQLDAALRAADMTQPNNKLALAAWDYANYFYRDEAFVVALGPTFGLSPAQIDELFRTASKVP